MSPATPHARRLGAVAFRSGGSIGPWNRWDITPGPAIARLLCHYDGQVTLYDTAADGSHRPRRQWSHPIAGLRFLASQVGHAPRDAPFTAGWCGHLSYELGHWFEPDKLTPRPAAGLPLYDFTRHTSANVNRRTEASPERTIDSPGRASAVDRATCRDGFRRDVARVIDYIRAGDIFQANLSHRLRVTTDLDADALFDRLQAAHPSWYTALLDRGDYAIVSNSPELFLDIKPQPGGERLVTTRPIKGTRPNRPGMADDLLASAKDAAELNMIVDLQRNDLGRVCEIGSVRVSEPRHVEDHGSVLHGVAGVTGTLRPSVNLADLLMATFPGGSITGAPKIRAMQIIDELEPIGRGPYCGAIGFISDTGHVCFNVAIRTLTLRAGHADLHVGAGIVADSDPAAEHDETIDKAAALLHALGADPDALR